MSLIGISQGVLLIGVLLIGVLLIGVPLISVHLTGCASHRRVSHRRVSYRACCADYDGDCVMFCGISKNRLIKAARQIAELGQPYGLSTER